MSDSSAPWVDRCFFHCRFEVGACPRIRRVATLAESGLRASHKGPQASIPSRTRINYDISINNRKAAAAEQFGTGTPQRCARRPTASAEAAVVGRVCTSRAQFITLRCVSVATRSRTLSLASVDVTVRTNGSSRAQICVFCVLMSVKNCYKNAIKYIFNQVNTK